MYGWWEKLYKTSSIQNHRFGERPTRSRMSLRLSGTIEPSAVDGRSLTGVALMGKLLQQHENKQIQVNDPFPVPCGRDEKRQLTCKQLSHL